MSDTRIWTTGKTLQDALAFAEQAEADGKTSVSVEQLQQFGFSAESLQQLDGKQDGTFTGSIAVSTLKDSAEDYYKKMSTLFGKADANGQVSVSDAIAAGLSQVDADKLDANDGNKDGKINKDLIGLQRDDLARSLHKTEGQLGAVSTNVSALGEMLKGLPTTPDGNSNNPTHKLVAKDEAVKFLKSLGLSETEAKTVADKLDNDDTNPNDGQIQLNRLTNEALKRTTDPLGGTGDMLGKVTKEKAIEVLMGSGLTQQQAEAVATELDGTGANKDNKITVSDLANKLSQGLTAKLAA